jgi:hypothetical protein
VRRQLAAATPLAVAQEAAEVYVMRLETQPKSAWPRPLGGDIRTAEHCRRILQAEAVLYGLGASAGDDAEVHS